MLGKADETEIKLIAQLRSDVVKRSPRSHGYILMSVRIDFDGVIVEVRVIQSSLTRAQANGFSKALLGNKLPIITNMWRELPLMQW